MAIQGTALYWHRQDLRLKDNPALQAASEYTNLIIVFIYEPFDKWPRGEASQWWLHHSLSQLAGRYEDLGQRLFFIDGRSGESAAGSSCRSEALLVELVKAYEVQGVFWNRRYDRAAIERDTAIKSRLGELQVTLKTFNSHLLKEPWQHNKSDGTPYKVFTPLWRRFRQNYDCPSPLPSPKNLPPRPPEPLPQQSAEPKARVSLGAMATNLADFGLLPTIPWAEGFKPVWQPGENGAQQRLADFLQDKLVGYKELRDQPALDYASGLSPHLHFGEISPADIWRRCTQLALTDEGELKDQEGFLSEVVWREFAYHLLYHYPEMADQPWKENFSRYSWRPKAAERTQHLLKAWQKGRTGVPLVDAGMRQLWQTGTMHNRVRMVVGSYLTKNLRIPWQEGAAWFYDTLVDADLAANSFNWQWVAGSGADAAPYFRIFNPVRQGQKFDPEGVYVRQWVPEIAALPSKYIHEPWLAPKELLAAHAIELGTTYPEPLVDLKVSRTEALAAYDDIKS